MKILLTGGSGLLGKELQKYLKCDIPSHHEFDITKPETIKGKYDLIIHAAAYTDVVKAEKNIKECNLVNIQGTLNLLKKYPDIPFVFISSEYAKKPVNYYSFSKTIGEMIIQNLSSCWLIIRTLFKPTPWPWEKAFVDQYTQGDYVDVIAPLIAKEIKKWDRKNSKLIYVGTGRKIMFELAKRTKLDVKPNSVEDIKEVKLPKDYI